MHTAHAHRLIAGIHEAGCLAGVALNPGTDVTAVRELSADADLLLCMTVNPGWGGQAFIRSSPDKVRGLHASDRSGGPEGPAIEVDGGIGVETAPLVAKAGANLLVAGSAIFASEDPGAAYQAIATAAGAQ